MGWPHLFAALARPRLPARHAEAGAGHHGCSAGFPSNCLVSRKEHPDHARLLREQQKCAFPRAERYNGCCPRPLNLPDDADQVLIKRPFDNGLLTIILDEREARASKQSRLIPN
ncbi:MULTISPECIES: Hsp20 family protein [Pseudomonas]|uniref:Hsp20 family protein n=1 Tax=Pseudomonas TaxID=286 RepID=UPI0027B9F37D|nr:MULTISPECIES: Hsp20 family protein [Pseudomonas putida group]